MPIYTYVPIAVPSVVMYVTVNGTSCVVGIGRAVTTIGTVTIWSDSCTVTAVKAGDTVITA